MKIKLPIIISCLCAAVLLPREVHAQTRVQIKNTVASNTYEQSLPKLAVDGNTATSWNAGGSDPQWISLETRKEITLNQIELVVAQSPAGRTVHKIETSEDGQSYKHLITLDQITQSGQTIKVPLLSPVAKVRFVRITTLLSPSWVAWKEIRLYEGTQSVSQLRYFGYMSSDGLGTQVSPTYYSELEKMGNTNIAWSYVANLPEFRRLGIKAVMTEPRWIFFDSKKKLLPDWENKWKAYSAKLEQHQDIIYGFYFDEPVWYGYSKDDFLTATKAIRDTFPDKAILVFEAWPPIVGDRIPDGYYQYVTDIGHDYYPSQHGSNSSDEWGKYLDQWEKFKPHTRGKRIWFVADGYSQKPGTATQWPDMFERFLSLSMSTDNAVGMFSFVYNSPHRETLRDVLDPAGSMYNPGFRSRHLDVGKSIIRNASAQPGINEVGTQELPDTFRNRVTVFLLMLRDKIIYLLN